MNRDYSSRYFDIPIKKIAFLSEIVGNILLVADNKEDYLLTSKISMRLIRGIRGKLISRLDQRQIQTNLLAKIEKKGQNIYVYRNRSPSRRISIKRCLGVI